ncbi:unnamed protein product [Rotaria sordida]|uniref:Uncharacterized protein n=1 Tax=Rotaria sordida TaxID=392033 RepID=A0A815JUF8_9BILA|nr:unnamed protein product [Rotaria sordida]
MMMMNIIKKNIIQRLLKCFHCQTHLEQNSDGRIRSDQSLTALLDEFSTTLPLLMQRTLARHITLEKVIDAGRYGSVHLGKWRANHILHYLVRLCGELWIEDRACRLSSLNVKKQLKTQMSLIENNLSNINIES